MGSPLRIIAGILSASLSVSLAGTFPNYDDPVTGEAPLPHPVSGNTPCEVVDVLVGVEGRGHVLQGMYHPPSKCGSSWSQVVLQLSGAISGHQYDRFGSLFFRGVELLRLTTPEPSPAGIFWRADRDVTDYTSLFMDAGEVKLDVQNYVTEVYTGVFEFNVSFAFYGGSQGSTTPRTILPLRNMTEVLKPLALDGPIHINAVSQVNMVQLPNDTLEARLDLFASGHGREEFWYSLSGGAYRELDVYVDGVLAGAQIPYPTIYTGGMNPLLWRPLTGILSFDMPPYTFDLTPFLGWLTDGEEHNITIDVVGDEKGFWFLNGVLALRRGDAPVLGGGVEVVHSRPLDLSETWKPDNEGNRVQETRAVQEYHVRGHLVLSSGENVSSEVSGQLSAEIVNKNGKDFETISALFNGSSTNIYNGSRMTTESHYPMLAEFWDIRDATSVYIEASVKQSRNIVKQYVPSGVGIAGGDGFAVVMKNEVDNLALYNRTNHVVYVYDSIGKETFTIGLDAIGDAAAAEATPCYAKHLASALGAITQDDGKDLCRWPSGVYGCGSSVCGDFVPNALTTFVPGAPQKPRIRAPQGDAGADSLSTMARIRAPQEDAGADSLSTMEEEDLLFRSPLHGEWIRDVFEEAVATKERHLRGS